MRNRFAARSSRFRASSRAVVVLELDLIEPGERVSDVRRVDDRKTSGALRVDVRERSIGQLLPFGGTESRHDSTLSAVLPLVLRPRWVRGLGGRAGRTGWGQPYLEDRRVPHRDSGGRFRRVERMDTPLLAPPDPTSNATTGAHRPQLRRRPLAGSPRAPKRPARSTAAAAPRCAPSTRSTSSWPPASSPRSWGRPGPARARSCTASPGSTR